MSKADGLFKKLGYYHQNKPADEEILCFYVKAEEGAYIVFYKNKTIATICNDKQYIVTIDLELLQAINEKVKELRLDRRRR